MSANITDYFNKASNMNGSYPAVATVTSARSVGGATLSCDDLSSWATDTPVHFSTFQTTADGSVDTTTQTDWKGIVVGNTITEMTRLAGAADSGNASGDRVELNPTIGWLDDLVTGLLVSHKQNGGLKDSSVTESTIATSAVTNSKIADSAVTNAKISDGTIQAQKIDFTTIEYSTSNEIVVGKWIDNKTIYCKIVTGTAPSGDTSTFNIAHGISNLGTVLPMTNLCLDSGANTSFSGSDGTYVIRFEVGATDIKIMKTKVAWKNAAVRCALYYTKSS